ncbi:putative short-chain dehydrogenase [Xylaria nigripes]|nr:putative short-chain dehydrogenase [Xylaria nigripes]
MDKRCSSLIEWRIRGKTVLVTGCNVAKFTHFLSASQSPAYPIIASRPQSKIQQDIYLLKADYLPVDYRPIIISLSSQKLIVPALNILINSASVAGIPERTLSEDGIKMHFATNHIGHWLLTCLLMPKLIEAASKDPKGATHIVNVSSEPSRVTNMRWSGDMNFEKLNIDLRETEQPNSKFLENCGYKNITNLSYIRREEYNQSKVANLQFGIDTTKRLYEKYGMLGLAVHPGVVQTELVRNITPEARASFSELIKTAAYEAKNCGADASTSLVAGLDPKLGPGETRNGKENYGAYLLDCQNSDLTRPGAVLVPKLRGSGSCLRSWSRREFNW